MSSGGGKAKTPKLLNDNLKSKQFYRVLDLVSEGPIYGPVDQQHLSSFMLNKTPVTDRDGSPNINGVSVAWRPGTEFQEPINGFSAIEATTIVNTEVAFDTPLVRTVTDPDVTQVRLNVGVTGLTESDTKGNQKNSTVVLAIETRSGNAAFSLQKTVTITGKISGEYLEAHLIDASDAKPFDIRVRRVTPDSTSDLLANGTIWNSFTEISDDNLSYPFSAIVGAVIDRDQYADNPSRTFHLRGLIVDIPDNYDPFTRSYSGLWLGGFKKSWTDNPAWLFRELVKNTRFGLARRAGYIDVDDGALYILSQYCDQLVNDGYGGKEPRMRLNAYITEQTSARDILDKIASMFRGIALWDGMRLTVMLDAPQDPIAAITNANVVNGEFKRSSVKRSEKFNAVVVSWTDPDNGWEQVKEYVSDDDMIARSNYNETTIEAFGCTSRGQAWRAGKWLLETSKRESSRLTFQMARDAIAFTPGDIVEVMDNNYAAARLGGRVVSHADKAITVDADVSELVSGSDTISLMGSNGKLVKHEIESASGRTVTLRNAPVWVKDGTVFVISTSVVSTRLFRILSIAETETNSVYSITAGQHDPHKQAIVDEGAVFDIPSDTLNGYRVPNIENLRILNVNSETVQVTATWETATTTRNLMFELCVYSADGKVVAQYETDQFRYDFYGLNAGIYSLGVRGRNDNGMKGAETQVSLVIGAPLAPSGIVWTPGIFSAGIAPVMPVTATSDTTFEFWSAGEQKITDLFAIERQAQFLGRGNQWNLHNLKPSKTYYVYVRTRNAFGVSSFIEASGQASDDISGMIDFIDDAIRDTDTYKELDKSIQDNLDAIQKEVADRSAAITKEATDRAAAISKETTARSQALTKEASDRTAAIAAEATTRAQQDQKVAADAANGLLNEQLTREAAISETNLIIQNKTDSLAQSIAQVAAGSGTQFDSLKIWHFNSSGVEGWTGNGTPTVVDNCLRPANHANNPYVVSPASLAVDAASYRFVKLRIRKVGKPAWRGQLRWRDTAAFNDTNMVTLPEPAFDASGVATIDFSDIKWNTLANVAQIRLDIGATQTASDYFLIDWIAVGRPAPGASTAALEDEATARIAADSAEATARSTLAAQLRGGTDGTDPSKLNSGLIYNERQVRISSEKAIAEDVEALETNFNENQAAVQQSLETLTDAQTSQGQAITNISASLKYANIDAANMLTNGSFETDFDFWDKRDYPQAQSIINGGAYSGDKVLRFTAYVSASRITQKNILLLKGRTYRLSAVCKFSSDAVAGAGDSTKLAFRNSASDALIKSVTLLANGDAAPTAWTERSLDYTVGNNNDLVVAVAVMSYLTAGTMDIDFVRVMDITDAKAIETKADAGALSTLDGKVKAIGDTVDAQGTALTQVKSSIGRRTVFRAVSVGSGGNGGITAAGIFREDGTKAATPARSYMLVVFSTNADGSTTLTRTNYDLYGNAAAASAAFNDAVAALANGTYVAVTTYDEPNGSKSRIYDAIESLGGSREAMDTMVSRSAYILLGCKGIGKGNGQELVSPVGGAADARVSTAIEFVNGTMIGLGTGAAAVANANATATSNLSTTVTQQGQTITAQGKSITQLTTDVGGKASQKALNIIDQRLTDAEGEIDGQQTAINGLTTNLGKKADSSVVTELTNTVQGQSDRIDSISLKTTRVDLTGLDQDTYYAVTMTLPSGDGVIKSPSRIRVVRPLLKSYGIKQADGSYKNPDWATHANGFSGSMEWTAIGSGYGANDIERNVYEYQFKPNWITGGVAPVVNVGQMANSSNEYIYLRGGSQYDVSTPYNVTPVLRTDPFTATSQTISPIAVGSASVIVPSTIRQDTVLNAAATTALKSSLKDAAADTENMIANGSGESGLEFWEGSPQPAVVTTSPYLGTKCFEYSGTASMLMFQRGLTMLKDRTYRVSLMAKFSSDASVDATTGWGNTKASIRQSESNAFIAEVNFKGSGSSLATAWTEFSFEYTPNADLLVRLAISSLLKAGKMWIDNIRIEDVTDARANATTATAVSQLQTTVKNQGDTLTAQAQSIQSLNTNLGNKADASALTQTNATVTQQGKDIAATTKSVSDLKTRVEGAESGLNQTFESIAQAGLAQFRGFWEQRAEIVSNDTKITASINEVNVTIANEAGAVAQQMSTLQASVGDNAAAIQVTSSALADVSGKLSAQWGVKVQVDAQGRSYVAGMQLGIDGNGSSQFLIDADTFGIYNPNAAGGRVLAFAVSGATAYLRAAMIQDLSIDFGKISDTLRSTNFVPGQQGWNLPKNGNAELNNVTIRGTVYANAGEMNNIIIKETCTVQGRIEANDGWFKGTVYAEKLEGDVVKSFTIGINGTAKIEAAPYPRRIVAISAPMMAATSTRIENSTVTYLYGQAHMTLQLFAGDGGTANIFDKHISASNANQTVFDVAEGSWLLNPGVYYEVTYRASGGVGPSGFPQNYTFLVVKN